MSRSMFLSYPKSPTEWPNINVMSTLKHSGLCYFIICLRKWHQKKYYWNFLPVEILFNSSRNFQNYMTLDDLFWSLGLVKYVMLRNEGNISLWNMLSLTMYSKFNKRELKAHTLSCVTLTYPFLTKTLSFVPNWLIHRKRINQRYNRYLCYWICTSTKLHLYLQITNAYYVQWCILHTICTFVVCRY